MKAAVRDRYGSPDVVEVREIDVPVPTDDQVLVRVHAASVNRGDLDWHRAEAGLRAPLHRPARTPEHPHRAGRRRRRRSVGPNVTRFQPGDRVFGDLYTGGQGSFAEYVCARETSVRADPRRMTFEDAATLPHAAILALQGLRRRDGRTVGPGDKVLIDGASGNVGPFAVQIAKSLGAEVTGVASTDKLDFVRSLGADHVIDYTTVDYTTTGERYDWILDVDSHHSILERAARAPTGRGLRHARRLGLADHPGPAPRAGDEAGDWQVDGPADLVEAVQAEDVATLTELIAAGKVKPVIDRRYPLAEIVEALRWVDDGHARGKVIVTMPGSTV